METTENGAGGAVGAGSGPPSRWRALLARGARISLPALRWSRMRLPEADLAQTARAGLGLIYPPSCIACGAAVDRPQALCADCWTTIRFIERPYCERLGTPFALDIGGTLHSPAAIADPPVFQRARAVAAYDGAARSLVHKLKYNDRIELSEALGRMMLRAGSELLADADLVVPVPLHRWRLWRRRFNQAAALAQVIARHAQIPCDMQALRRVKITRSQVGLTRSQRRDNLSGAFRVAESARLRLAQKRVLVIDDVVTTGSTANAVARALLRGGAQTVDVLSFACVVTES
ncbi:MAG: putative amidophosphoribosyltransferase [Saliniramus fredricksonii]|uniref:ComF family protein n=2 Tax=Saliniramus fredricksonii TaxID=1653334 RepID=A0A0P7X3R0_9HYPH|nr:MAG: putative amidophosphoribosyltransferase [Saliniramus fredricksonii]SCC82047.1 comF family protein [Saliniramus fredricksonii]